MVDESTPTAVCQSVLKAVSTHVDRASSNEAVEAVATFALERLRSRLSSLEEVDHLFRKLLYRLYWGEEDYLRAATVLSQSRIDSVEGASAADRADTYVRVAQAYLQADDDVNADRFIKRATEYVFAAEKWDVTMKYRFCFARIRDAQRKFNEAAQRYLELAQLSPDLIDEAELLTMLQKAVTCIILAPAGPQRQRVMGALCRDARLPQLPRHLSSLLEKMYRERFVAASDAAAFEADLMPHQKAVTSDGSTVFAKAMQEHNIVAASRVYSHILLSSLGNLMGVDPLKAEKIAAKMIAEKRLAGSIDQIEGVLAFSSSAASSSASAASGGVASSASAAASGPGAAAVSTDADAAAAALLGWDAQIKEVCQQVNACVELLVKAK